MYLNARIGIKPQLSLSKFCTLYSIKHYRESRRKMLWQLQELRVTSNWDCHRKLHGKNAIGS